MAAYDRMPIILRGEGGRLTPTWTALLDASERAAWQAIQEAIDSGHRQVTLGELAESALLSSWKFMQCAHRLRELGLLRFDVD